MNPGRQTHWEAKHERLTQLGLEAIDSGGVFNASGLSGKIGLMVLHDLVYGPKRADLPILYTDRSSPAPFPVGVLTRKEIPAVLPRERFILGMMSGRHPEMNYLVDCYINRNRDLSGELSNAEVDHKSQQSTLQALESLLESERGDVLIEVLLTGFEPMVVGFCRGVSEFLTKRHAENKPGVLVIRTLLYSPGRNQSARATEQDQAPEQLSPESPGAKLESYKVAAVWM